MKKILMVSGITIFILFATSVIAYADYLLGPNSVFKMHTAAGFNPLGLWIEGTMSDAKLEGIEYDKRVYARSGASGSYSSWKTPGFSPVTVTHRDYGAFNDDYAEVRGEWR